MPITLTQGPISAKTPTDLFATLALSPPLGSILPSAVPTIAFSPPTPPTAISLTQAQAYLLEQHLDSEGVDDRDKNGMSEDGGDSILPSASFNPPPTMPGPVHRPLASNEARQLSLLLTQHFFPLRSQPRSMMKESIHLAEKLHEAGIRWDTKRRVMGLHLRGIWEEGQKLSYTRTAIGGHGPMDLYVQGSFLSIAEEPHPLDPMPIPLELHPASFAALPKLTLQAGLANALPVAATHMDHHTMGDGPHQVIHRDFARDPSEMVHAVHGEVGDRHVGLEIQVEMMPDKEAAPVHKSVKDKWRDRKAKSLRIHTDGHSRLTTRTKALQLYPSSATLSATKYQACSRNRPFWAALRFRARHHQHHHQRYTPIRAGPLSAKYTKRRFSKDVQMRVKKWMGNAPKSAASARLTFGAWEVR